MIILEGPDGSGKSTLARQLADASSFDVSIIHRGGPARKRKLEKDMEALLKRWREPVICDRIGCISERIYGPILRGKNRLGDAYLQTIIGLEIPIIFCHVGFAAGMKRHIIREDEKQEFVDKIKVQYGDIWHAYRDLEDQIPPRQRIAYSYIHFEAEHFDVLVKFMDATFKAQERMR